MSIPGLRYSNNIFTEEIPNVVDDFLKSCPDFLPVKPKFSSGRHVAQYGYTYDYSQKDVNLTAVNPFPPIIAYLSGYLSAEIPGFNPNQCIINRYLPGQGINPHIDHTKFGDTIACFTFGGGAEIEFTKLDQKEVIYTEPNSLYILQGDSRYLWNHQMRPRLSDPDHGKRTIRYSITFRSFVYS